MKHRKPLVPMKYPRGIEYAYRQLLLAYVKQLKLLIKKHIAPLVPQMVREVTDMSFELGMLRQDAWQDDLRKAIEKIQKDLEPHQNKTINDMRSVGPKVNQFNRDEWKRLIRGQYGVDPTSERPDRWRNILDNWARQNAELIKDIPFKTIMQIRDKTVEALLSGKSQSDMADDIFDIMSERGDVTDSRAELIARDQVAKLNGNFTKERQADMGVESYIWRTVGDERVRDTHEMVDGMTFTWDNPPGETDGNHPGEDYQCRCWAEPILPEMMEFEASLLVTE